MTNTKILSFIFPVINGKIGGVQMLFINMITYLVNNKICNVRLYDYKQGLIRLHLQKNNIDGYDFVSLDEDEFSISNIGEEIFIMTNDGLLIYPQLLKNINSTKILIWDVSFPSWLIFNKVKGIPILGLRTKVFSALFNKKGVVFMESKGLEIFDRLGYSFKDTRTLFIPVNESDYLYKKQINTTVHIGYVGRSTYWKITPIIYLLDTLKKSKKKYQLTIITDNSKLFLSYLNKPDNVDVVFKENLFGNEMKSFILSVDIGIAMGTAALDFSKYGIPTILIDFSNKRFPKGYKFRWLFENSPGNLGEDINSYKRNLNFSGHSWDQIVKDLELKFDKISRQCFNYVIKHHSIEKIAKEMYNYAIQSELEPSNLRGFSFSLYLFKLKALKMRKIHRLLEND